MGKCLSRWCNEESEDSDDVISKPVRNGHSIIVQSRAPTNMKDPINFVAISDGPIFNSPPIDTHVSMFTCHNGTHGVILESADASGDQVLTNESARSSDQCEELFNKYCDPVEDCIVAEGVERLCTDLGVKPDDFSVLVLAWRFSVSAMCRFTRGEFILGCQQLGVDSLASLIDRLPSVSSEVAADRNAFRALYHWSYRFALDPGAGQRTLPVDIAVAMWRVVFDGDVGHFAKASAWVVPVWLEFVEHHSGVRGITRDTWDMFLNLVESLNAGESGDFSSYDETEAWPSLFDDFVKWSHARSRQTSIAWHEDSTATFVPV